MKKLLRIIALILLAALVLTGCKAADPTVGDEEPTPSPTPSPAPTQVVPTPVPSITPRTFEGTVETPEPGATGLYIDPIDKPALVFEPYVEYVNNTLGISFEVPGKWIERSDPNVANTIVFEEREDSIQSKTVVPSQVTIQISMPSSAQTISDAEVYLDEQMSKLREEYPSLQTSSKADNQLLRETGKYVTFWIDYPLDESGEKTVRMRGRCLVVPKGNRLYLLRYMCPADFNSDYENVYKQVRTTFKEL